MQTVKTIVTCAFSFPNLIQYYILSFLQVSSTQPHCPQEDVFRPAPGSPRGPTTTKPPRTPGTLQ